MPIRFKCPDCGAAFWLPDSVGGKRAKCKTCGALFRIPPAPDPELAEIADAVERTRHTRARDLLRWPMVDLLGLPTRLYRSAWRKPKLSGRRALVATIILAFIVIGLATWHDRPGTLPEPNEIQERLEIWAMDARPDVLRGRPLTAVPFTTDASTGRELFKLFLDDDRRPVAISAMIIDMPTEKDPGLTRDSWMSPSLRTDDEDMNHRARRDFFLLRGLAGAFLSDVPFYPLTYRKVELDAGETEPDYGGSPERERVSVLYRESGYEIEATIVTTELGNDDLSRLLGSPRTWLWVIKSRDW